jgi:IPT/TIG domain
MLQLTNFEQILHAHRRYNLKGKRLFNINVEGKIYTNIDLYAMGGLLTAFTIETVRIVDDGAVSISFINASPMVGAPKINAIAIKLVAPHLAHSVSNGPYLFVDVNDAGVVNVPVDGSNSHTHGPGLSLRQWIWKEGSTILAVGETADLVLPVGSHSVALTVVDNAGNAATETTNITVLPFGYPSIKTLSPDTGNIAGNETVTISGSGFTYSSLVTSVNFGHVKLTGTDIQIVDASTIVIKSPPMAVGIPVSVAIQTPLGVSTPGTFTYVASSPISFISRKLMDFGSPTVARFGPDKKLYVATQSGQIAKFTLNDSFTTVVSQVVATVAPNHVILGLAFDPMETGVTSPSIYCTASFFFHGDYRSSSGVAINGRILKVSGANLDVVETIIQGLPVSDHDHGMTSKISILSIFPPRPTNRIPFYTQA